MLLPQSYQYPNLSEGADRVGGQLRGDKECPFRDVIIIIIKKRISRAPFYHSRWQHRALYNNTNHTHTTQIISDVSFTSNRSVLAEFGGRCRKAMLVFVIQSRAASIVVN